MGDERGDQLKSHEGGRGMEEGEQNAAVFIRVLKAWSPDWSLWMVMEPLAKWCGMFVGSPQAFERDGGTMISFSQGEKTVLLHTPVIMCYLSRE